MDRGGVNPGGQVSSEAIWQPRMSARSQPAPKLRYPTRSMDDCAQDIDPRQHSSNIKSLFLTWTQRYYKYQRLRHSTCSGLSLINSNKVPTLCKDVHLLKARVQHCTRYFLANGLTNPDIFQPKTFLILREIIPQNFSLLGFADLEKLGNKQTNRQTHSLTDKCFYRVMIFILV